MVKLLAGHGADIEKRDRVSKEESMTSLLIDSVFFFFFLISRGILCKSVISVDS